MKKQDFLLGLMVIVCWGLNFIAIKVGVQDVPPLLLGTLRFVFACFPAIFFVRRPPVPWVWLIALGLTLNVGQFAFLFLSIKVGMPAGLSSLVLQAQAFFTLFVAVLWLGERWQWNHLAGLALAAAGMALIGSQQGGEMTLAGFTLTIAAAACWGTGNVLLRRATVGVPAFPMLSLIIWAGVVAILPLGLLSLVIEGVDAWVNTFQNPSWNSWVSLGYLAYVATLIGYGIWGKLMSRYPAGTVAPLALLVPVVGLSSSAVILGESLTLLQGIGAVLIMSGLTIHVLGNRLLAYYNQLRQLQREN